MEGASGDTYRVYWHQLCDCFSAGISVRNVVYLIIGFIYDEKLEFPIVKFHLKLVLREPKLKSKTFVYEGIKLSFCRGKKLKYSVKMIYKKESPSRN